ncbi:polyprenyl diphosphate synthase [Liquorilactobacillus aquaticus DSM 21051]|uniref:Polyprenyl diphosphate synthase n=1 Tax=Liquorilactobacillus aquaticus DSM 21051 TaxID=1423725 RepID=A0A0R2D6U4_9LACO|nr:polyprenyl synthetase family protein [Liquorilactobacillus aquaticus]KRM96134.1 polyprenyl diphosphate synthase [Liquorilactobacillus aquaticus DSM 21051]
MLDLWNHYPIIARKLEAVNSLINQRLTTQNSDIQNLLAACAQKQGKLLRPGLFLLFSQLGDPQQQDETQLFKIAASLELLHRASLIHDDIIDDSPLRHGTITIQANYGKDVAVYAGDLLFTVFFQILIETMNGTPYMEYNASSMKKLLLGELSQMHARFNKTQTIDEYLENIKGKTAALFKLACTEGAHFGHADKNTVTLAAQIGENIGISFQIFDDILDYDSNIKILKKPVLEDIGQGVYTSPLLFAIANHPEKFAPYLDKKQDITPQETKQVAKLVHKYDGISQAKQLAQTYTEKALSDIDQLPHSETTNKIRKIALVLLKRSF